MDAYDAIEVLLVRVDDEPARVLAEAARAVADLWNDPPVGVWQRATAFPELAAALDELLGGGPNSQSPLEAS
jgi:DTW domain-containing protein YfiP